MPGCRMQADIKDFLTGRGIEWEEADDLAAVAGDVDVLYQTRIQKERFQARPCTASEIQSGFCHSGHVYIKPDTVQG